jgi:DNA-directed RNA polymerase alpha subunit
MLNADQLRQFADILETAAASLREMASVTIPSSALESQTPLRECNLSVRSRKVCARLGVETVEQLAAKTEHDIRRISGAGNYVVNELRTALKQFDKDLIL